MNTADLSPAERRVWDAFPSGELVDLSTSGSDLTTQDAAWGAARRIRAEVLVALLAGAREPEPGQVAAVRITGAYITDSLNLGHAQVSVPLALTECVFEEPPHLYWAQLTSVHLIRCRLPGLVASGARIEGHLWLEGSVITSGLVLDGAHISGILNLSRVQLTSAEGDALLGDRLRVDANVYCNDGFLAEGEVRLPGAQIGGQLIFRNARLHNPGGPALYASRLNVASNVFCDGGFQAEGEVRLRGGQIGGYLSFVGAKLSHTGLALNADDLTVDTDVYCSEGFSCSGEARFNGARIGGQLSFRDAKLSNPSGTALSVQRITAEELLLRPAEPVEGVVDYSYARINLLRDDPTTWASTLQLDGLAYETLEPPLTAKERLAWIRRDKDGYIPQPYERLAATYRTIGMDADGRNILLAKQRDRRSTQSMARKAVGYLQDVTVGYGYAPFRAGAWLLALQVLGTVVFAIKPPEILDDGHQPHFNAFFYTLDLLLPIGSLGQEVEFSPAGIYQVIANILVAGGLLLGLTVAAGATRALSRE
ncbi:oxidoreductase [Actinocorallia lasiicapitis]